MTTKYDEPRVKLKTLESRQNDSNSFPSLEITVNIYIIRKLQVFTVMCNLVRKKIENNETIIKMLVNLPTFFFFFSTDY